MRTGKILYGWAIPQTLFFFPFVKVIYLENVGWGLHCRRASTYMNEINYYSIFLRNEEMLTFLFLLKDWFKTEEKKKKEKIKEELTLQ